MSSRLSGRIAVGGGALSKNVIEKNRLSKLQYYQSIVKEVALPGALKIKVDSHPEGRTYLQIYQEGICNRTNIPYKEGGRKWDISEWATESEIVLTAFKAALTFIEHELREGFMYKGKIILDPHIDVNALLTICDQLDKRE